MLITIDDVKAWGNDIDDDELTMIETLIAAASDAITSAAGCPIAYRESTVRVIGLPDRLLELPGLPIDTVHEVHVNDTLLDPRAYTVVSQGIYRSDGWSCGHHLPEIHVRYSHGLKQVPADVKALAVGMVAAGLHEVREGSWSIRNGGLSSVSIDDYRESYATTGESTEMVTPMSLPSRTRAWLRARFGGGATVVGML